MPIFFVFIVLLRDLSGLLDIFHVTVIVTVALVVGPVFCLGRFKFDQLNQELIEEWFMGEDYLLDLDLTL